MNKVSAVYGEVKEETYDEFKLRYKGFGETFYMLMEKKMPEIFSELKLYVGVVYQTEDSYALYDSSGKSFVIQLDPYQVIIIWDDKKHYEFGEWDENAEENAIKCIEREFLLKE